MLERGGIIKNAQIIGLGVAFLGTILGTVTSVDAREWPPPNYTVTELGGAGCTPLAISPKRGQISGRCDQGGMTRAVLWSRLGQDRNPPQFLGFLGLFRGIQQVSEGLSVNDQGVVVGYSYSSLPSKEGLPVGHALLYESSVLQDLATGFMGVPGETGLEDSPQTTKATTCLEDSLGADIFSSSEATGINNAGMVTGTYSQKGGKGISSFIQYQDETFKRIPLDGAEAVAVNDSGLVAGNVGPVANEKGPGLGADIFLYDGQTVTRHRAPQGFPNAMATSLNDCNDVGGYVFSFQSPEQAAFFSTDTGAWVLLPKLPELPENASSKVTAMNCTRMIGKSGEERPVLYYWTIPGQWKVIDLNTAIPPGWQIVTVNAIDSQGRIVGVGRPIQNPPTSYRTVLLTPKRKQWQWLPSYTIFDWFR